jgi:DivIVA domain-containing protein
MKRPIEPKKVKRVINKPKKNAVKKNLAYTNRFALAEQILLERFNNNKKFIKGYDKDEVDDFLDLIIEKILKNDLTPITSRKIGL